MFYQLVEPILQFIIKLSLFIEADLVKLARPIEFVLLQLLFFFEEAFPPKDHQKVKLVVPYLM